MTAQQPGAAPEHMYVPSDSNLALMAMEVTPEHASYGIDPGGIGDGYLRGVSLLKRTEMHVGPEIVQMLREERTSQGVSQRAVAAVLGIHHTWLVSIETGYRSARMTVQMANDYADLLGVELNPMQTEQAAD